MTAVIVILVGVALAYANSLVQTNLAGSDYNSAQQFMQTSGLSIDDVAWTVGKASSVLYSARYGWVQFYPTTLNYTVWVKVQGASQYQKLASYLTGTLSFNLATRYYSLYNGYYSPVYPASGTSLTLSGTWAPVARVFVSEKLPMGSENLFRVAVAPSIRFLNSTASASGSNVYYMRLYLPSLNQGTSPNKSQTITLSGSALSIATISKVTSVNVTVSFPNAAQGFDNTFYHFPSLYQLITPPGGYTDQVVELYVGTVSVQLGL